MAGGYLPWVNAPENRVPDLIGGIGDTLVAAAQRKQQERQFAAKNLLEKQRLEADQARMRAEESRAQAEEHRAAAAAQREEHRHAAQQADATASALPQIHQLLEAGDEGTANALAQAHGIKLQQRPLAPPNPGTAPGAPQAPGFVGPLETPEQSQQRGMYGDHPGKVFVDQEEAGRASVQGDRDQDPFPTALPHGAREGQWIPDPRGMGPADPAQGAAAMQETQRLQAEREQYAQQLADHPRLVAEHQAHLQAYQQAKQSPVYDIQTPYGQSTFDLGAVRQHQQAQQAETAGNITQGLPPQYALRAGALIKSGLSPQEVSREIQAQMRADEDRAARGAAASGKSQTALAVANLRKRAGAGAGGMAPGGKAYQAEEGRLASELTKYETQHKLTGKDSIAEHQHELGSALQMAEAPNQNGVTQLKIMDKMIRAATGLGVRNQTLTTYMQHMGGLAAQGESKLEQWASGAQGKAAWANVVASVRGDLAEAEKRGGEENKAYWDMVGASPAMQRHQDLVQRRERGAFGGMAGYGKRPTPAAKAPDAAHPAAAPIGETKTLPNGTKVRKVGSNQWEAVP